MAMVTVLLHQHPDGQRKVLASWKWSVTWQALMRLFVSPMSCRYTAAALYSGTADSSSSTKRWFNGSTSAAARSSFAATDRLLLPQNVCGAAIRSQGPRGNSVCVLPGAASPRQTGRCCPTPSAAQPACSEASAGLSECHPSSSFRINMTSSLPMPHNVCQVS